MSTALAVALIALVGSVVSTAVTVFGAPVVHARSEAKKVLDTYREPLLAASFELQARLYNVLRIGFVEKYIAADTAGKRDPAIDSTMYVIAQFFGWREIIRGEVQYLRFSRDSETREVAQLLQDIGETFLSDKYGPQFMIWRVEQRGIGERMIQASDGKIRCMGYAAFMDQREGMEQWLEPLARDLQNLDEGGRNRLTELQHRLLELVRRLDEERTRYPFELDRV